MRAMASIRQINEIRAHGNADALDLAIIDGWQCVVKKGDFTSGQLVVYMEIDSWVPNAIAPFLSKGKEPREFEGVKGERLRTVRLRGEVSQGLVLPLSVMPQDWKDTADFYGLHHTDVIGQDVSEILNVKKYERPLAANMQGQARGNFPNFVQKTDQERVQNLIGAITKRMAMYPDESFEVSLKLDGSSTTFYVHPDDEGVVQTGVCSRNLELKTDESNAGNIFVQKYHELGIAEKLRDYRYHTGRSIAVQGELWGTGINGNWEGVDGINFHVFDVFDCDRYRYLDAAERYEIVERLGLPHVPVLGTATLANMGLVTVDDFLKFADRPSLHNPVAEGVVFKSLLDPQFTFKAINNKYLLEGGD
jgi:RNA ligase (TIGR02306 family)